MIFSDVKEIQIPEGTVKQISCGGVVLWEKQSEDIWPDSYQIVEYIESTGTQYIDTGVTPDGNTRFEIKVYSNNGFNRSSGYGAIFGAINSSNTNMNRFGLSTYGVYDSVSGGGSFRYNKGTYSPNMHPQVISEVSFLGNTFTKADGTTQSITSSTVNGACSITVFAQHYSNGTISGYASMKLYYFKLYSGSILIRDFIPCYRKRDKVIGLYDAVNDVFYTNSGTGTFLKGQNGYYCF